MSKKDPNYAVKVEKAIAEKYGHEAVQNPKSNWDEKKEKEYLEQLKAQTIKEDKQKQKNERIKIGGFFVNKKLLNREKNRKCDVCKTYSFNIKDDFYFNKYECCSECYLKYVEFREERWKKGWRPNENEN